MEGAKSWIALLLNKLKLDDADQAVLLDVLTYADR